MDMDKCDTNTDIKMNLRSPTMKEERVRINISTQQVVGA